MKAAHWQHCNVLGGEGGPSKLWQFVPGSDGPALSNEREVQPGAPLPGRSVGKSWSHFWRPRMNIAWISAARVFVRLLQLPATEPSEIPAMVEFQLEKISPLPLGQIAWSCEMLSIRPGEGATVAVMIAERKVVEEYLGVLEGSGYFADRLEVPQLRELAAIIEDGDGVYVLAREEGAHLTILVAWRIAGRLQCAEIQTLPVSQDAGRALALSLQQAAWAGEFEGWLAGRVRVHLVAADGPRALLEPALAELADGRLESRPLESLTKVARLSASAPMPANLMPPDFLARYRQQFVDRLWMRGLAAMGALYFLGLLGYFGWLRYHEFKKGQVDSQIAASTGAYTNALQLKAKMQVLQDQANLRFAALECWKTAAECLPEDLTLTSFAFQRGKKLTLYGTVAAELQGKVSDYNEALSKATLSGQTVFSQVNTRSIAAAQTGRPATWTIECEIKRSEGE